MTGARAPDLFLRCLTDVGNPDVVGLAESFGMPAWRKTVIRT